MQIFHSYCHVFQLISCYELGSLPDGSQLIPGLQKPLGSLDVTERRSLFRQLKASQNPTFRIACGIFESSFKTIWVSTSPTLSAILGLELLPGCEHTVKKARSRYQSKFMQFSGFKEVEILEVDVVIAGSGCGGAVAARNLAQAGLRVAIVEKGYDFSNLQCFPMSPMEAKRNLFENGGGYTSDDGSISITSGATWGGGGTVNWSAALQLQDFVREDWSKVSQLPLFTSERFQQVSDNVYQYLGVCEPARHSKSNHVIMEGAQRLGYRSSIVPQNTGFNKDHYCGQCTYGCENGEKQGPAETYLRDAAAAGALLIDGCLVNKVISKVDCSGVRHATGLDCSWTSRESRVQTGSSSPVSQRLIINAKKVVVSCGSLNSPLLLKRSGLQNPNIGQNLRLHPVMVGAAVFEEEMKPWEGSALTTVVNEFENLEHGHGVKIEACCMLPSIFLPLFPWKDGIQFKLFAAKLRFMTSFICLVRDQGSGTVYPDDQGHCRVDYKMSSRDLEFSLEGIIAAARMAFVSGAIEFHLGYDFPPFVRDRHMDQSSAEQKFEEWIIRLKQHAPLDPEKGSFVSAHQMGTCRIGASPSGSVVNHNGMTWEMDGLYVIDSSVFPAASGVNPMITILTVAEILSSKLADSMKGRTCRI